MKQKILYMCFVTLCLVLITSSAACSDSSIPETITSNHQDISPTPQPMETLTEQSKPVTKGLVKVVYFHRAQRCKSCTYAEDQTRYTLETYFIEELNSGILTFTTYNLQDEANAQIVDKYNAHSSSLFITEIQDGIENIRGITDIWTKIDRDEAFTELVRTEIGESLGKI